MCIISRAKPTAINEVTTRHWPSFTVVVMYSIDIVAFADTTRSSEACSLYREVEDLKYTFMQRPDQSKSSTLTPKEHAAVEETTFNLDDDDDDTHLVLPQGWSCRIWKWRAVQSFERDVYLRMMVMQQRDQGRAMIIHQKWRKSTSQRTTPRHTTFPPFSKHITSWAGTSLNAKT
jgi:hypothetical protein